VPDVNLGQVASVAWENIWTDGAVDNTFTSQALLYLLKDGGYQEYADGGRLFEATVEYAQNTTFRSIAETETIDTSRIDIFDAARYEQKIYAGSVVFSDLEDLRNAVANRKIDVVKSKLKNGVNSALQGLNQMLWGDGSGAGGKDMDGVQKIIPINPTTGVVGSINAQTWAFWRSKQALGTKNAAPGDNLRAALLSVHNQCSLGGTDRKPTGLVSDRASFELYVKLLTDIERLNKDSNGSADPDLGWLNEAIEYMGLSFVYDEDAVPGNAYFVNKAYLKLVVLKGGWMKMKQPVEPSNALMRVHRVFTVGNLCASARRHLGVVNLIT
jgi:hypothetical protein